METIENKGPEELMTTPRRYGEWAGNPKGYPEDKTRCVEPVTERGMYIQHQCSRKRGHGPDGELCRQHAAIYERRINRQEAINDNNPN